MATKKSPDSNGMIGIVPAARYVGVSERTIRRYISDGRLTGYRFGPRLIRVDRAELDALMRPMATAGDR